MNANKFNYMILFVYVDRIYTHEKAMGFTCIDKEKIALIDSNFNAIQFFACDRLRIGRILVRVPRYDIGASYIPLLPHAAI